MGFRGCYTKDRLLKQVCIVRRVRFGNAPQFSLSGTRLSDSAIVTVTIGNFASLGLFAILNSWLKRFIGISVASV